MKKIKWFVIWLIAISFTALSLGAKEISTVANFNQVNSNILKLGKEYGAENVLAVFDLDCTLITNADNFGSDVWWNWQSSLLSNNPDSPYLASKDFNKLLFYQGIIQQFTKSYATEEEIPADIAALQKEGYNAFVLTSRGPEALNRTEALLKQLGFDFSKSPVGTSIAGLYAPYDISNPEKAGLTEDDIAKFNLKPPRSVRYDAGVMLSSGQNKGIMLKTLLHKLGKNFKAIVFVDDTQKHVDNVWAVYKDSKIDINCYRYSYDDAIKRQFQQSDKNAVIQQWKELQKSIDNIYGKKLDPKDNY